MDSFDYWRLCDELTIVQAALLIVGEDPSSVSADVETWDFENRPVGYEATRTALSSALTRDQIEGTIAFHELANEDVINVHTSTVIVDSLRRWLLERGLTTGFFFPNGMLLALPE